MVFDIAILSVLATLISFYKIKFDGNLAGRFFWVGVFSHIMAGLLTQFFVGGFPYFFGEENEVIRTMISASGFIGTYLIKIPYFFLGFLCLNLYQKSSRVEISRACLGGLLIFVYMGVFDALNNIFVVLKVFVYVLLSS